MYLQFKDKYSVQFSYLKLEMKMIKCLCKIAACKLPCEINMQRRNDEVTKIICFIENTK